MTIITSNNNNSELYRFTDLESDGLRSNDESNNYVGYDSINNSESEPNFNNTELVSNNFNNTELASNNASESSCSTLRTEHASDNLETNNSKSNTTSNTMSNTTFNTMSITTSITTSNFMPNTMPNTMSNNSKLKPQAIFLAKIKTELLKVLPK
ncbi:45364_t:CDS:2, partial [Gigaspora margarita]